MQVEGSQTIGVSSEKVWLFIKNPLNVGKCLPDAQQTELLDAGTLRAKMKFGLDFAKGTFVGVFKFEETAQGHGLTVRGDAKGLGSTVNVVIDLDLHGEERTRLDWKVNVEISGLMKKVVTESNLKALADNMANEMFDCISSSIG